MAGTIGYVHLMLVTFCNYGNAIFHRFTFCLDVHFFHEIPVPRFVVEAVICLVLGQLSKSLVEVTLNNLLN